MKTIEIKIDQTVKYFTDIKGINPIPTNRIIDKTLPGLGATFCEIKAKRNSILILPNVATILSKHSKHAETDNTFAVYENVSIKALEDYLATDLTPKKILTTPEGFVNKIKPLLGETMYKDYFLLLDECHKIISDSGYRDKIIEPMDDFFKFKFKAMISATAIIPSDERFVRHRFKLVKVQPIWDYKKDLNVIKTSNPLHHLLIHINMSGADNYCIFFNTIQGIVSTIEGMKNLLGVKEVEGKYRIFCSKESAKELRRAGHDDVSNEFTSCLKYNFFTSSFFNGLDIDYAGLNADVIMISDVKFADFSSIDPLTDAVQIRGRFRPYQKDDKMIDWVDQFIHIVKTDSKMPVLNQEQAKLRIARSKDLYDHIQIFQLSTNDVITQSDLNVLLSKISPYATLLNKDKTLNSYKRDNYLFTEKIKSYYTNRQSLATAYLKSDQFNVNFHTINYIQKNLERLKYGKGKYSDQNYLDVTNQLWEIDSNPTYYPNLLAFKELYRHFELIVRAYFTLGIEVIDQLGFQHKLIMQALILVEGEMGKNKFPVIDAVQNKFKTSQKYLLSDIKPALQEIFDLHNVPITANAADLEHYFEIENAWIRKDRAYRLLRPKHNISYVRN